MLKLYRIGKKSKEYWETWLDADGQRVIHWGKLGHKGNIKTIENPHLKRPKRLIDEEIDRIKRLGFAEFTDFSIVLIEFQIEGFGKASDLDKRHKLETRMNETLGWHGLGHCDGGSIGSGSMEVCNFVVDAEIAINLIKTDIKGTVFEDYSRIYEE